jgi:5-formyltetrahydrofolate cyclo-ligase
MTDWQGTNPDDLLATHHAGDMTIPFQKKVLREKLRQRVAVNSGDSSGVVRQVVEYLDDHPQIRVVALFAPMPGEVDLLALVGDTKRDWVFPKVTGDLLTFHHVRSLNQDLIQGAYGILEPTQCLPLVLTDEIDLFLCPGLGFDTRGGRIGRGKGFYDKVLAEARGDATRLGICFSYQLVNEVVMESHDIRMDAVIAG